MIALKAEYGVATSVRWHIVPDTDGVALCNRLLSPIAELRTIAGATQDDIDDGQLCPLCASVFVLAWDVAQQSRGRAVMAFRT